MKLSSSNPPVSWHGCWAVIWALRWSLCQAFGWSQTFVRSTQSSWWTRRCADDEKNIESNAGSKTVINGMWREWLWCHVGVTPNQWMSHMIRYYEAGSCNMMMMMMMKYDGICWVYGNSDSTNAASMSQNGFWRFGTLGHWNVHLTEISKPKLSHCIPSSLLQSAYQSTGSGKQFHWHYCHVWHCLLWECAFTMRWCKIQV